MKRKLLVVIGLLISAFVYGQTNDINKEKYDGKFIQVGSGLNFVKFRDLATSPLYYSGFLKHFKTGFIKYDNGKERELSFSFSSGKTSKSINKTTYNSDVMVGNILYSKLYPIWSNDRFTLKVGGEFKNTFHYRENKSLLNNAIGMEFFSTLFASSKISWNISNKETKRFKILFIPFTINPHKRDLSFKMKLSLLNSTYRNGYSYLEDSSVRNANGIFNGYKFKVFNGYRFGTELNYTVFLKNGNGIKLGYELDVYKTGGNLDKFQIGNFKFKIALLFKTK